MSALGKTVFLTTHFMDEAEYLAHRVAVIAHGQIVAEGSPRTIGGRERMVPRVRLRLPAGAPPPPADWGQVAGDGTFCLLAQDSTKTVHEVTSWALQQGLSFELLEVTLPSLEDVYLELTGG